MVLLVRLALGAASEKTRYFRGRTRHSSFLFIEDNVIRGLQKSPRVLLMGSSRMRYGLHEADFAELAGLPADEVANLGVVTGTPQDALWQIRRNPGLLDDTRLVVLDLYRHMLKAGPIPARTFRYASVDERLHRKDLEQRVDLVLDGIFRHRADRRQLTHWLRGLAGKTPRDDIFEDYQNRGLWEDGEYRRRIQEDLRPSVAALEYMQDFEVSTDAQDAMQRFLHLCDERDIAVVLVHTPSSSVFRASFSGVRGAAEGELLYWEWVNELKSRVPVLVYQGPEDVGVTDADFVDYAHLERDAARIFAEKVVADLGQLGVLED